MKIKLVQLQKKTEFFLHGYAQTLQKYAKYIVKPFNIYHSFGIQKILVLNFFFSSFLLSDLIFPR